MTRSKDWRDVGGTPSYDHPESDARWAETLREQRERRERDRRFRELERRFHERKRTSGGQA